MPTKRATTSRRRRPSAAHEASIDAEREAERERERLANEGATLTGVIRESHDSMERAARRRGRTWKRAIEVGATARSLADRAGVHHSQVQKAIERYGESADDE